MWKHLVSNVLTLFIVGLAALGGYVAWAQAQYTAAGPLKSAICVQVESGTNMRAVADDLLAEGAISNGAIFRLGAEYSDKAALLKAGSFLVGEGASMADIVDIVTRGGASTCGTEVVFRVGVNGQRVEVRELEPATSRFETVASFDPAEEAVPAEYTDVTAEADTRYRIAVAEGVTSWQVVEALKAADFLEGSVEDVPPEGTLAPDSYEVRTGTPKADVLARMAEAQEVRLAGAWANRAEGLPLESPEEALILASIIEKETAVPEERRTVASVFINRLNRGIRLQTDPTVIYGITEGQGVLGRGIRQSELQAETPWNTYVIDGLPPTPIANPGLASIEAALDPETTNLIFFVADGTGGHAFAETLDEHNANVSRWREIEREREAESNAASDDG